MLDNFVLGPAIAMGLVLSLIEIYFVSVDEAGMRWLSHALHAVPTMMIFTAVAMNVGPVLSLLGLSLEGGWVYFGIRALVGIVAMVKVKVAASITGKGGVGESNMHVFIIGVLIAASPYIWEFALEDVIGQYFSF